MDESAIERAIKRRRRAGACRVADKIREGQGALVYQETQAMRSCQQVPGYMGAEISCRADDQDVHRSRVKLFGFLRKRTEILDRALGTLWFFCEANTAAMILQQVAETDALLFCNERH